MKSILRRRFYRGALPLAATAVAVAATGLVAPNAGAAGLTPPPAGVEAGQVSVNLPSCSFVYLIPSSLGLGLQGTFDSVDGPGQQFDLTNGGATVTIPSLMSSLISFLGDNQISINVSTLDFNATGATPATLNAAATPISVKNIPVTSGQPILFKVPSSGALTIGPFTAGSSGNVSIGLGAMSGTFTLSNNGTPNGIFSNMPWSCSAPSPAADFVTATIGGHGTGLNAPGSYSFPTSTVPVGDESGLATTKLSCKPGPLPQSSWTATYGGTVPSDVTHGTAYTVSGAGGDLVVPAKLVNALVGLGAATGSGSITTLNLTTTNASPAVDNLAATPIPIGAFTLKKGSPLVIPIPATGSLTTSITPTATGMTSLGIGSAAGTVTLKRANGTTVLNTTVSCAAPATAVNLVDLPVS